MIGILIAAVFVVLFGIILTFRFGSLGTLYASSLVALVFAFIPELLKDFGNPTGGSGGSGLDIKQYLISFSICFFASFIIFFGINFLFQLFKKEPINKLYVWLWLGTVSFLVLGYVSHSFYKSATKLSISITLGYEREVGQINYQNTSIELQKGTKEVEVSISGKGGSREKNKVGIDKFVFGSTEVHFYPEQIYVGVNTKGGLATTVKLDKSVFPVSGKKEREVNGIYLVLRKGFKLELYRRIVVDGELKFTLISSSKLEP